MLSPITGGVWSCTQNGIAVPFAQKGKLSLFAPPVQDWVESTVHSRKIEIRASPLQGKGVFATANISKGEVLLDQKT